MSPNRYEQETIINFNKLDDDAAIFTYEMTWQRHIETKLGIKPKYDNGKGGRAYILPKSRISKPRVPRKMTEKQRIIMGERLQKSRQKGRSKASPTVPEVTQVIKTYRMQKICNGAKFTNKNILTKEQKKILSKRLIEQNMCWCGGRVRVNDNLCVCNYYRKPLLCPLTDEQWQVLPEIREDKIMVERNKAPPTVIETTTQQEVK